MNADERRNCMKNILFQNEDFIIIGLTGRTGSGCTDAARIFGSTYKELELPQVSAGPNGFKNDDERDYRIIKRFASVHWSKFDIINSKTIISSFLLEEFELFLNEVLKEKKDHVKSTIYDMVKQSLCENKNNFNQRKQDISKNLEELVEKINNLNKLESDSIELGNTLNEYQEIVDNIANYSSYNNDNLIGNRLTIQIDELISSISASLSYIFIKNHKQDFIEELTKINQSVICSNIDATSNSYNSFPILKFAFVHDIMPEVGKAISTVLKENSIIYIKLYQKFGNSIRRFGKIVFHENTEENHNKNDIFSIPRRIAKYIKALRHPFSCKTGTCRTVRVVIDSIKSVFEANYLRQRYSSFYLFAITSKDDIRRERLTKKNYTYEEIQHIDWNEYSSEGFKIYKMSEDESQNKSLSSYELSFAKSIKSCKNDDIYYDGTRLYAYKNNLQQFYLQDVAASIENADAFIINNHNDIISKNMELRWAIVRNVSLIMFPGLIMPSPVERCMQIAFAAKCNSGCLSRQVGAVVTDKDYNILSIGWNDVPSGDISCSRKNLIDLCRLEDKDAYSDFELMDDEFRNRIEKYRYNDSGLNQELIGLPLRYCFKDIHVDGRNPMRSRAMHAEEKALATCGEKCREGFLFTTSSPCEMCSKNAKNHHIKKIYYIELYPGISETQYSNTGDKDNRAEHILFSGAVGRAYMQMYTPIMPQKDILEALGINDWFYNKCDNSLSSDEFSASEISLESNHD